MNYLVNLLVRQGIDVIVGRFATSQFGRGYGWDYFRSACNSKDEFAMGLPPQCPVVTVIVPPGFTIIS